jgi:glycosyltransferase involved in cell wall biosynthesis
VEPPQVTVVIPTRNRWRRLSLALHGALRQEDVDVEIVVVDEASSDETPERLAGLDDPRVRVFRHERARGVAQARNRGIAEARGEWIAFLDDDDVWSPRKLRLVLHAASSRGASFAYSGAVYLDERMRAVWVERAPDPDSLPDRILESYVVPAGCSNVVCSTNLVRRLGGFDERLFHLADWDLWIRLAEAGPAAAAEQLLVGYVRHPSNMLMRDPNDAIEELDYLAGKHESKRARRGVELDKAGFSRWIATVYRQSGRRLAAVRELLRGAVAYRSGRNLIRAAVTLVRPPIPVRRRRLARFRAAEPDWIELYRQPSSGSRPL